MTLAGSVIPLTRSLTLFSLQYGIGVATAMRADWHDQLAVAAYAVSCASIGYCVGWMVKFRREVARARRCPDRGVAVENGSRSGS